MKAYHYTKVPEESVEGLPGISMRWVIGENVGAPNFAMRVFTLEPGAATWYHGHDWEHQVYVLEGEGSVRHAGGEVPIGAGSCVYVAPNEMHQFTNRGQSALRFICVIPNSPQS